MWLQRLADSVPTLTTRTFDMELISSVIYNGNSLQFFMYFYAVVLLSTVFILFALQKTIITYLVSAYLCCDSVMYAFTSKLTVFNHLSDVDLLSKP